MLVLISSLPVIWILGAGFLVRFWCDSQFLNSHGLFACLLHLTSFRHPRHLSLGDRPIQYPGIRFKLDFALLALKEVRRGSEAALESFCL